MTRIRLINTFEPVTSIYRDIVPRLANGNGEVEVLISAAEYRTGRRRLEDVVGAERVRIIRMPVLGARLPTKLRKVLIAISFATGVTVRTLFGRGGKWLNVFFTQPPMFWILGRLLRRLRKQKYVCVLMDLYPHCAIEAGILRRDSVIARACRWVAWWTWRGAERVVVIGRCMEEVMIDAGVERGRISMVSNWADDSIRPIEPEANPLRAQLGWQGKFIVLYSGNLGVAHYFDDILKCAVQLRENTQILFVFIGDGARRGEVLRLRNAGAPNIGVLPWQEEAMLSYSLGLGDLHFVSQRERFTGLVVPSKAYATMAAGRPLLFQGDRRCEIARVIEEVGCGTVVEVGATDKLLRAIGDYVTDRGKVIREGRAGLAAVNSELSRSAMVTRYVELLNSIDAG